ncbi:MAG: hypothetical protein ACKO0M_04115 [Cyanobium sp.]
MHNLLTLAFLIPLPFVRPVERTDQAAWGQLLAAFTARSVSVSSDHPRCREPDLYGLYVRGHRTVVVCERGDRSATLRHEGWHLVQHLCLWGKPWLSPEQIEAALSRDDRRDLQLLVQPQRWHREAEARSMAHRATDDYLQQLNAACAERWPTPGRPASVQLPVR